MKIGKIYIFWEFRNCFSSKDKVTVNKVYNIIP